MLLNGKRLFLATILVLVFSVSAVSAQTVCESGFRPVNHVMGVTCVSESVERVVTLEWTYVEDVLALGVQPIGVADIEGFNDWVKLPIPLDETVVDVGLRWEPNLETLTSLNPDLIIGYSGNIAASYDAISAIAPTIVFEPYPTDGSNHYEEMVTTFTTIAEVLNREEEAEAVLQHLEDHYAAAQAALAEAGRVGEDFILSQGWTVETVASFRLFTDNAMAVQILENIGLENAWDDSPQQYGFTEVGIEGFVELANMDFNFFYVAQGTDNDIFNESPLFSSLPFVASGHAYWMGGDVWLFGGPLSAELLVDTVLTAMGVPLPVEATPEPAA